MNAMKVSDLDGKSFTLWLTDEAKESAVFPGIARWDGSTLFLERNQRSRVEIRPEWYERIQLVSNEEVRRILQGADCFLRLYVGNLPSDADEAEYEKTGLRWPS
jgi:hypothetical protein